MAYDPFYASSLRLRPMRPDEALQDAPDNVSPALTLTQPPPTAHQPPALAGLSSAPQAALRSPVTPSSQAVFQPTLSEPKSPAQSGLSAVAGPDAAPTPASPADWTQRAWERLSALEEKTKAQQTGDFTAGVKSGWEQTKGLGALALSALGQKTSELTDGKVGDDLQKWGYETYQKTEQAAEPYREGRTTKVEDIRGPGSAVDWLQFTLGNVAPSVAESILAGAVGAGIGAAATPAGSVLGAAGGAVGKGAIKKFLADFAEKRMVAGASREAAEKMAGAAVGAGIGTFAAGYQMGVGDVYSETLNDETGKGNATSAMLWAIPYAGIEAITDLTLAGSILKGAAGANLLKRIPAAFAKGAMLEGGQELTQETINILAGLQEGKEYRTDEVLSRLGNALAAGAVAGGVLGGAGGIRRAPDAANQDGASQNPGANPAEPASGLGSGAPAIGFNRFLERQATQLVEPPATAPAVDPETSITPALAERAAEAGLTPVDLEAANQELISPTTEDMQDGKSTIPSSTQEQNAGGTAERQASTIEAQGPEGLLSEPAPISAEAESGASGTATADTRGPAGDPVDPGAAVPAADAARAAFQPTHELSDGTPARATPEPNVYEDADGNEIEDRYATPITPERLRPAGGLETEVSPLPVGSDGNDAARLPDAAQAPDRQGMAAAPEIAPTDETLNADQTTPIETATPAETGNTGTAAPTAPAAQADAGTESAAPTPAVGTGLGAVEAGADAVPSPRQSITGGLLTDAEETVTLAALKTARNPAGYLSQRFANDPRRKQLYEEGHAANLIAAAKGQPEQDPTMGPGDGQPVVKESLTVAPVNQPPINDATPSAPTGNAPKAANEAGGDQSPTFPDASGGRIPLAQQQEIVRELADLPVVKRRFAGRKAVEKALPAGTDEQDVTRIMQALVKAAAVPTVKPEGADAAPASAPLAARWETLPAPAREAAVLAAGWTNANGGLNLAGRGIVKKQWDKISPESRAKLEGAAEPKRLDHGVLNIPGRTNGINAELDRYQAEQAKQQRADAKASAKERRTAKAKAKALFAEHGESIVSRHKDNLGEKKVRQTLDQMVKWEPEKFIALAEKHVQETQPAAETPTERAPDVLADYPDLAGKGAANTETAQQKEQTGKTFTYRVKPHPLGGFMIDSDDGGGTVIERRPRGPSVLDPVGARSFKSESDARAFMSKKGMALASDGQASGGQTAPPAGKAETKPRPLDDGEFIAIEDDPRLQDPVTLETVKRLASEAGWQEVGGKLIRNADGSVKGRTAWLPIRDWWLERPDGVTKAVVDRAMTKHAASQPLNKPERAALRFLADLATSPDSGPTFDDITEAADGDIDGASVADVRAEFDGMVDEDVFDDLAESLIGQYADQPLNTYVEALRNAIRARIESDRATRQGDLPQGQGDFSLTGQRQADLDAQRQADEQRAKAEAERLKAEDAKRQADGARNAFDLSPIETNPEAQKAVDRGQTGMDFGATSPSDTLDSLFPPETNEAPDKDALFDALLDEEFAEPDAKPTRTRKPAKPRTPKQPRTASESAASAAKNTASAFTDAAKGLLTLFDPGKGKLNSGLTFDEETYAKAKPHFMAMAAHLGDAAQDVADLMRAIIRSLREQFGMSKEGVANMKPYIIRFAEDIESGVINLEGTDVQSTATDPATDRGEREGRADQGAAGTAGSGTDGYAGPDVENAQGDGQDGARGVGVSGVRAPAVGGRLGAAVSSANGRIGTAGSGERAGGDGTGAGGLSAQSARTAPTSESAVGSSVKPDLDAARKVKIKSADAENIQASLPHLLEGQQADVLFAEKRFASGGRGVLFTNGTGTGKTFTGLGIVARQVRQGKANILITVPGEKIASDWIKAAQQHFGLDIHQLADTKDAGPDGSVVITTYANFGQNQNLVNRQWDMLVHDEAHYLSSSQAGDVTAALKMSRALTGHPRGALEYAYAMERDLVQEVERLRNAAKMARTEERNADGTRLDERAQAKQAELDAKIKQHTANRAALWESKAARRLDLSATPFSYHASIDSAEGFLFEYGADPRQKSGAYNTPDAQQAFMIEHFGYRMRTGKLNKPEANVDQGLMERQFNRWLNKSGALSGRMLDVDQDYSREFVAVDSLIGNKIDEGMDYIRNRAHDRDDPLAEAYRLYLDAINEQFDYHARIRLLEAVKAPFAVARAKQHIAMGRKVVIFHSRIQGGSAHPFHLAEKPDGQVLVALRDFQAARPDLFDVNLGGLRAPLDLFKEAFGSRVTFYNGTIPKKDKVRNPNDFVADDGPYDVIVVQDDAGKEGISLHDTTGKYPRALINIGLPTKPTQAIQIEGRTYRVGQKSDAMFEYFNTGTNFERWTFAQKIAERASTAENLAMGEQARRLRDSFVDAFENPTDDAPHDGQGKSGKETDRASGALATPFEEAKSHYFGNQKNAKRRSQREGVDYFATPEPLGLKMVEWAGLRPNESALEPSAGHGAIARYFPENVRSMFVEPSSDLMSRLALRASGTLRQQTFEALDEAANKFDAIIMNPPFGSGGATARDHLAKAMNHLKNGGRIVALLPDGPSATKKIDTLLSGNDGERLSLLEIPESKRTPAQKRRLHQLIDFHVRAEFALPAVTFERAGTSVATRVLIIDRIDNTPKNGFENSPDNQSARAISADSINGFFDAIEFSTVPARAENVIQPEDVLTNFGLKLKELPEGGIVNTVTREEWQYELSGNTYKNSAAILPVIRKHGGRWHGDTKVWTAKTDPTADLARSLQGLPVDGLESQPQGDAADSDQGIIEHTTQKGKVIRGIVRMDLNQARAKEIDPYTFKKDGGWFIREKYLSEMRDIDDRAPRFSLAPDTQGMDRAALERRLDAILGRWTGPKTGYRVVQRESDLPQPVLDALAEVRQGNPDAVVDAVMVNDEMWFVADHIANPAAAFRKLLHEGVGHIGVRRVFGNALDPVLDQIAKDRAADLTEIADTYGLDLNVTEDRREAAEELLAHLAETNIPADRPLLERVYQAIRAALRRMGIHLRMSDSDLREILSASRSLMERNDVRGAARTKGRFERGKVARGNEGRFSLADGAPRPANAGLPDTIDVDGVQRPTQNSEGRPIHPTEEGVRNFWRWFGDGPTDYDDRPVVFWHGGGADFSMIHDGGRFDGSIFVLEGEKSNYGTKQHALYIKGPILDLRDMAEMLEDRDGVAALKKAYGRSLSDDDADLLSSALTDGKDYPDSEQVWDLIGAVDEADAQIEIQILRGRVARELGFYAVRTPDEFSGDTVMVLASDQIKSAIGNTGDFSPTNPDIRFSLRTPTWAESESDTAKSGLRKLSVIRDEPTLRERLESMREDLGKRTVQAVFDAYAPLKELGDDLHGYMLARLSRGTSGAMEAAMLFGQLQMDQDGAIDIKTDAAGNPTGGFIKLMERLQGEHDRFLAWVSANRSNDIIRKAEAAERRAARLKQTMQGLRAQKQDAIQFVRNGVGRLDQVKALEKQMKEVAGLLKIAQQQAGVTERNLNRDEIDALMQLNQGQMKDGADRAALYDAVQRDFNAFNRSIMDIAEQSGLIDGASRQMWESYFYVPHYRAIEDGYAGPTVSTGLARQYAFKQMKGGEQATRDLMENTLRNWSHLLAASAKNRAMLQIASASTRLGVARVVPASTKDAVVYRVDGKETGLMVDDPLVVTALKAMDATMLKGPIAGFLAKTKRWLTVGVTMDPSFKFYRNMLRDMVSSMATSGLTYNPFANAIQGWKALSDPVKNAHLMAGGATIRFGAGWEGEHALHAKRLIEAGVKDKTILDTKEKLLSVLQVIWDKYQNAGDKVENMNRAALYDLLRAQGKSHLEASHEARDLMDFSLTGASAAVRFLVQTVPFMNARLQGLYKLGRAGKTDPRRILSVIGGVVAASALLMLAYKDDEDWKRREDWDRDTYWWFKAGDVAYRIPKPFEIGAIGSIAERSLEFAFDDEMTGRRFYERLRDIAYHQLAMNPIPQALKPALDVYANRDSFTGRAIESMGMERLQARDRFTESTSEIARQAGKAGSLTGLSPVQIDHLIRGYFGWMGATGAGIIDLAARPVLGRPERAALPLRKWTMGVAEDLANDPVRSRYVTQFYEQSRRINEAYASLRQAHDLGDLDRADTLNERFDGNLTMQARQNNRMRLKLSDLNTERRKVGRDQEIDAAAKRVRLREIDEQMDRLAQRIGPTNY